MAMSAGLAFMAFGAVTTAGAQRQAGRAQQQVANFNAQVGELQAGDALYRGRVAEERHRVNTRRLIGSQRAAFAASGVVIDDMDSTAANVFGDTAEQSELDAITIRQNAAMEAWGYRVGAADARSRGAYARAEGDARAIGTITSTAGSVLYDRYGFGSTTRGRTAVR